MSWAVVFRTSTFRTSALASAVFASGTLLLFAFIYWQTAGYETERIDAFLVHESLAVSRAPAASVEGEVRTRFSGDMHRLTFAAVLTPDGGVLAGDLASYPSGLPVDGAPHVVNAERKVAAGLVTERVAAVARALPDRRVVVIGRSRQELSRLTLLVGRALALGLGPAFALALAAGAWASLTTTARIAAFQQVLDRIMDGHLGERLPISSRRDTLDILAASVNRTVEQVETLLEEVRGVGDSIAHDLRTPLARMRARLEGGRRRAVSLAELDEVASHAIADLDQCFAIITALLRIGEIESARRRSGFSAVSLSAIVAEVGDLYQPVAELRGLRFVVRAQGEQTVSGDRDLLFEVVANLTDNAVKFSPENGEVRLELTGAASGPVLRISDSGEGIALAEREAVLRRFYRSERAARVDGSGLGLSLVAAILRLHGFPLRMLDAAPGFTVEVECSVHDPGPSPGSPA